MQHLESQMVGIDNQLSQFDKTINQLLLQDDNSADQELLNVREKLHNDAKLLEQDINKI